MNSREILDLPKHHRRAFLGLILLLVLLLVIVDFTIVQGDAASLKAASGYIQSVIGAILVSLLVVWLVGVFVPPDYKAQGLEQLQPTTITAEFEKLLSDTRRWRYKGNFGRYLRGKVLPTLADRSNVDVDVSLIDPRNEALCKAHANYRSEIPAIDKGRSYTPDVVALEVIVTIIHCAWYVTSKAMSIDLHLSTVFDPVRIDSNDEAMILTVEDRRSPALKLSKDHFMYEHFEQHMRYAREQGHKLDLTRLTRRATISEIQESDISQFLTELGMEEISDRLTADEILKNCREVTNPYAD